MQSELERLEQRYPDLEPCMTSIEAAYEMLALAFERKGKLLICGNGGSASDGDHIVGELMKGFELKRPLDELTRERLIKADPERGAYLAEKLQGALPAISLSAHAALSTAITNDTGGDLVYAQQVIGYGESKDVIIGISTSGNSPNVLNALSVARSLGMRTIGMTGQSGGKMHSVCDVLICVPSDRTLEIQERHLPIYHTLCIMLEGHFFGD